jgi:aminopeptidase N
MLMARILGAAVLTLGLWTSALGQGPDPRIDEAGRERAYWPPDRPFDHLHMRLELTIPTMEQAQLQGLETLRITPVGTGRTELRLSAKGPRIRSIEMIDRSTTATCTFTQDGTDVYIDLPRTVNVGEAVDLRMAYDVDFSNNKGEGLTWSVGKATAKSVTRQFPQIHSQGQADENSRWFICHDFPNERLTTEVIVNIEDGYEVLSNGVLKWKESLNGRVRWYWSQEQPHPNYLVSLVIGKFAVVEVGGPGTARPGLAMPVYVEVGREENAEKVFRNTPAMIAAFERIFDEPYPWAMYAQACLRDFTAGGMENTAATSLYDDVAADGDADEDDLISHELAHQWLGNLLTCDGWEHLWLNEGWASYAEALWREEQARQEGTNVSAAYQRAMMSNVRKQRSMNRARSPEVPAMVTNRYVDPDDLFSRPDDVYSKGAVVLHMLRERLGEATFLAGVRKYIDDHKERGLVDSDDFRRTMEDASGQSLERFFDQWVYRPGPAELSVELEYAAGLLSIQVSQTQQIDRNNPAYAMSIPVRIKFDDETTQWESIDIDTKQTRAEFRVKGKPAQVTLDPNVTVFARTRTTKPLAMWIDEARSGPTLFARAEAIEMLGTSASREARRALAAVAGNQQECQQIRRLAAERMISSRVHEGIEQVKMWMKSMSERRTAFAVEVAR